MYPRKRIRKLYRFKIYFLVPKRSQKGPGMEPNLEKIRKKCPRKTPSEKNTPIVFDSSGIIIARGHLQTAGIVREMVCL